MNRDDATKIHAAGQLLQECTIQPSRDFKDAVHALLEAQETGALPDELATDVQRVLSQAHSIGASLERAVGVVGDVPRRLIAEARGYAQ